MTFSTFVAAKFSALSAGFMALPVAAQIAIGVGISLAIAAISFGIYLLATSKRRAVSAKLNQANEHIVAAEEALKAKNTVDYKKELTAANDLLVAVKESKDNLKPTVKQVEEATKVLAEVVTPKLDAVAKVETALKVAAEKTAQAKLEADILAKKKEAEDFLKDKKAANKAINHFWAKHKEATPADIATAKAKREAAEALNAKAVDAVKAEPVKVKAAK